MKCKTCFGEGGITVDNFGDVQSFECPDCKGTGVADLIQEVKEVIETKQLLFQYDKELYLLIGLVERLETAEKQRDEAIKALEKFRDENSPGDFYYGGVHDEASEALERIKGAAQAEGHQSTESAQAQAGGRIGGSHE